MVCGEGGVVSIKGWFLVSRPPLLVLGFVASLAVALWSGAYQAYYPFIWLYIAAVFTANWSLDLFNEVNDLHLDCKFKPWKPLPRRLVDPIHVHGFAIILFGLTIGLIGVLMFLNGSWISFALASAALLTGIYYNFYGKSSGILGNTALAGTYGLAVLFIASAGGVECFMRALPFAVWFAVWTWTDNLIVQWQDIEGDTAYGLKTAAVAIGKYTPNVALLLSLCLLPTILLLSLPPVTAFIFSLTALFMMFSVILPNPDNKQETIEVLVRKLVRSLLIVAFVLMALGL